MEQQAAVGCGGVKVLFREHPIQDADFHLKAKWKSTVTAPVLPAVAGKLISVGVTTGTFSCS